MLLGVAEESNEACILDVMGRIYVSFDIPGSILEKDHSMLELDRPDVIQTRLIHVNDPSVAGEKGQTGNCCGG